MIGLRFARKAQKSPQVHQSPLPFPPTILILQASSFPTYYPHPSSLFQASSPTVPRCSTSESLKFSSHHRRTSITMSHASSSPHTGSSLSNQREVCPDRNCLRTFPDFHAVYEHYTSQHPAFQFFRGRARPFKCPFCSKTYINTRYTGPHLRRHRPQPRGSAASQDQLALIQQSRVAVTDRERPEARKTNEACSGHNTSTESEAQVNTERNNPLGHTVFANDSVQLNSQPTTSHPQQQPALQRHEPLSAVPELSTAPNTRLGPHSDAPPASNQTSQLH